MYSMDKLGKKRTWYIRYTDFVKIIKDILLRRLFCAANSKLRENLDRIILLDKLYDPKELDASDSVPF